MTLIIDCPSCQRKLRVPDDLLGRKVKCPSCATMFTAADSASAPVPPPPPPVPAAAPDVAPSPTFEPWPAPGTSEASPPALSEPASSEVPPSEPLPPWRPPEVSATAPPPGAIPDGAPSAPSPLPADRRPCPSCRQSIPVEARRCRYCGEPVNGDEDGDERSWERPYSARVRRDSEPHRGTMVLVFGILSIVLGMSYFLSLVALPMGIAAWVMGQRDLRRMRLNEMDPQGEGSTQAGWICGIIGTVISGFISLCCVAQLVWFVVMIVAGVSSAGNNTNRPTTRPPSRFSAPGEILRLGNPWLSGPGRAEQRSLDCGG